ncbi:MAG: T9SS type A sorting domain-containing protein [Bacteroidales bacterium]|nr:T9SS type A sorting domain-containing protein [Bacteroidales bacterium]
MKFNILVLVFALFFLPFQKVFTQTIQNDVIASAGDTYILENTEISWTLGESSIESYQSGNISISQGFHQPIFKFFEIPEQENPVFQANIFPNPTCRFIQIELTGISETENFRLILSDMMGKVLLSQLINPDSHDKIDLVEYSQGILLLKIIRVSDGRQRTFKIVRTGY